MRQNPPLAGRAVLAIVIGKALTEGKLSATAWSSTCARSGIGDVMIAGPDLPIAS